MTESIAVFLNDTLGQYLPPELLVFIVSMIPILELRGGMIVASLAQIPELKAMLICIAGNLIPVPIIIFFIRYILDYLQNHGPIQKFARWIERKSMKKGREMQEKYPKFIALGLFLFVAIPLPGTGAWTGSLIAVLLDIKPKTSIPAVSLGVVGASCVMWFVAYWLPGLISSFA